MLMTSVALRLTGEDVSVRRAFALTARNATVLLSGGPYKWVVLTAFAEPLLYLIAIGWGVGALIGKIPLGNGQSVSYLTFLAPAMLAASTMNGAIAESALSFFMKIRYQRLYEPILNTPVTPFDIALGELFWAIVRGCLYSAAFLAVMVGFGLTTPLLALATLPAALLLGIACGGLGLAIATWMRNWQHFDYVTTAQFALFLFSATFVPLSTYPAPLQAVVQLTPLYHGAELIRGISLGQFSWTMAVHVCYLLVMAFAGLVIAGRRTNRILR